MTRNARDLVASYYAAFNAGDHASFLALLTDDVAHDINQGAREIGKDAFRRFLARMDECYAEQIRDLVILTEPTGRRAAAEFVVHGTYKKTDADLPPAHGQTYALPGGAFFEIHDGKIARVTNTYNLNEWLRQVRGETAGGSTADPR
jgi:steroid delta-isomerase-like uncharacterized protein